MNVLSPFTWLGAGPNERANWVRQHREFSIPDLRKLFNLTENGLVAILKGDDWRPEYNVCD